MIASASNCKRRVLLWRSRCPGLSHLRAIGGTAKRCADWAFVSGVSPVSPNLKLIDRTQNEIGRGGISCRQAASAETGGTGAKVTRVSGETTGLRHTWDRWDRSSGCQGERSANLQPCDHLVAVRRQQDLTTRLQSPKN
jgi:hypothetical protein